MTTHTPAPAKQDPISEAILLLTEEADSLSDCHTRTPGDWAGEPEAKAHYDHVLAVIASLSKLRASVADERAAFEKIAGLLSPNVNLLWNSESDSYRHKAVQAAWRLFSYTNALASAPVSGEAQSEAKYQRMFVAACEALAAISERLGLDPNDGEPDVILSAIGELMGRANDAAPQASEAVRDAGIAASEDVAPWADFAGNPIKHGDRIRHPKGLEGVVVRLPGYADAHDAWCVAYQDRTVSRLSLQIGERGQAVVQSALSAQPGAQKNGGSDE